MKINQSILIVDDDFAHRTMLRKLLGGWGYEIFEADDWIRLQLKSAETIHLI